MLTSDIGITLGISCLSWELLNSDVEPNLLLRSNSAWVMHDYGG
jgi:hypothetical protein